MIDETAENLSELELIGVMLAQMRTEFLLRIQMIEQAINSEHGGIIAKMSQQDQNLEVGLDPNIVDEIGGTINISTLDITEPELFAIALTELKNNKELMVYAVNVKLGNVEVNSMNTLHQSIEYVDNVLAYINKVARSPWELVSENKKASVGILSIMFGAVQIASFVVEWLK